MTVSQAEVGNLAFHRALMAVKGPVDEDSVLAAAAEIGPDLDRLKADMADPAVQVATVRATIARTRGRPAEPQSQAGGG